MKNMAEITSLEENNPRSYKKKPSSNSSLFLPVVCLQKFFVIEGWILCF
jgi:hypothetical protein